MKRASCAKCWSNIHIRIRLLFVPHSEQIDNLIVQSGLVARGWGAGGGVYQSLGAVAPIICDFRATADSKIVGDRKRVWIYAQLNITSIR